MKLAFLDRGRCQLKPSSTNLSIPKSLKFNNFSSYVIGIVLFVITIYIAYLFKSNEAKLIEQLVQQEKSIHQEIVKNHIDSRFKALERMAFRWIDDRGTPKQIWERDAKRYLAHQSDYRAIEWVDKNYTVQWVVPFEYNEAVIGLDVSKEKHLKQALEEAYKDKKTTVSRLVKLLQGDTGFFVYVPLFIENEFNGFILGVFDANEFFRLGFGDKVTTQNFNVSIYEGPNEFFKIGSSSTKGQEYRASFDLYLADMPWRVDIVPNDMFMERHTSSLPLIVLIIGSLLSISTFVAIQSILSRNKEQYRLLELEQHSSAILDTVVDAVINIDKNGNILLFNPAAEQMFGYQQDEVLGKNIKMLMPEPYQQEHDGYLHNYLSTGNKKIIGIGREVTGLRKDGSTFPMELAVSEVAIGDNVHFTGTVRNITDRKQAERNLLIEKAKLEQTTQYLAGVLDNAVDAIISIESNGSIRDFNLAAEKMFGYQLDEVLGKNIKMLMPEPYKQEHDDYLHNYLSTGVKKIIGIGREVMGLRNDGSTFPIDLSVSEVQVDNDRHFTGIVRDITDRKQAEEELTSQKEYYENLFRDLNVPAFMLDMKHRVVMWNKACETMTGGKASDVLGTDKHHKYFYDEEKPVLADFVIENDYTNADFYPVDIEDSAVSGGKRVQNWVEFPYSNRPPVYLTIDTGPVYDSSRQKIAVIQVMQDITNMKKLEEELERSNQELERFAYVASHDLQEPLRMVSSYTQLLAKRYKDKLGDDAAEFIDYAVDGANRMQTLVQDLLRFSRLNTREKVNKNIDTNELFQYAIQNLELLINETETTVTSDQLPTVIGDEGQLRQLFQNLIGNSIKYRNMKKKNAIHLSAKKQNKAWQFCVEDNGIGIAEEYYEKIFVIFKRLHTKDEYEGTGIGLALCKKIIENHHGEIRVDSKPGQGSRFYFTLPT